MLIAAYLLDFSNVKEINKNNQHDHCRYMHASALDVFCTDVQIVHC